MDTIKLYIVDDHKLFIEGVSSLLSYDPQLELIGFSEDPKEFIEKIDQIDADVYLVDINMPEMSGTYLTSFILDKKPMANVLILTMHNDFRYVENVFKSGALGYVIKSANIKELIKAIKTVAEGNKFLCESIQSVVLDKIDTLHHFEINTDLHKSTLTRREKEILVLITRDFTNKQIAEELNISEHTVSTHRKNIFSKTNAKSLVNLIKYAIKEGILDV